MLALSASLAITLAGGCSQETRDKILPIFFDGVSTARKGPESPPTRRVRRDLLREIEDLKRQLTQAREAAKAKKEGGPTEEAKPPAESAKTWEEAVEKLPKDESGHVDWVQALQARAIAPRPSPDPRAPEQAVLDLDLDLTKTGSRLFSALFPHGSHTSWLGCGNCHPAIFPLERGGPPSAITMAKIQKGEACGACHGPVAFGVRGQCARCHRAIPARADWRPTEEPKKPIDRARTWAEAAKLLPTRDDAPDWTRALHEGIIAPRPGIDPKAAGEDVLDLDVVRVPKDNEPAKAVFPHAAHTAWLVCDSCHPSPFKQEGGATPMSMDAIGSGELCGACHGKVAFPLDACGRCHPAMAGG